MRWLLTSALVLSLGCAYEPVPTAPSVRPPAVVVENPPPTLPQRQPVMLSLTASRSPIVAGEGLSLRALPIAGDVIGPATYAWIFGDGSATVTSTPFASHTYAAPGSYEASVNLTDANGRTAQATSVVIVTTPPREPSATRPPPPSTGLVAHLTCTAGKVGKNTGCNVRAAYKDVLLPPRALITVDWEWGDGKITANGRPAENHVYDVAGEYRAWVAITATTTDGPTSTTASRFIVIEPTTTPAPPTTP